MDEDAGYPTSRAPLIGRCLERMTSTRHPDAVQVRREWRTQQRPNNVVSDQSTHGPEGGDITVLAIDPLTPGTMYAGTRVNGVSKSTDGGDTWRVVNAGLDGQGLFVTELAIDPQTPTTLYLGTVSGLFKSIDGGEIWSVIGVGARRQCRHRRVGHRSAGADHTLCR